jgi:hypothetical protein
MISPIDNILWSSELVTGNAQFIEIGSTIFGSTIYVVSQVRADNTFAVFKSEPAPPQPGPGFKFDIKATYTFPTVDGKNNTSFDPVVTYNPVVQKIYIVGTQDNPDGVNIDVLSFIYDVATDTLGTPITLVSASYIRDSYDVCSLAGGSSTHFVAVAMTTPSEIWQTPTVSDVTNVNIAVNSGTTTLTVAASNSYSIAQPLTFSGLQAATFLNGITITPTTVTGSTITAVYAGATPWAANYTGPYTQVGYESGFVTWFPGHSLVGFEFEGSSLVTTHEPSGVVVIDASPYRNGNTFGAVSAYSPDGETIEVYYENHPKKVTFKDQLFNLNLAARDSSFTWALPSTVLTTFSGRYADSRLTVVAQGITRTVLQQYFSQLVHQNALVGNLLLGYYDGLTEWHFQTQLGSSTTSFIQGTLSVSHTEGTFVSYLAEPIYGVRGEWSPQVKTYAVNDRTAYDGVDYLANQDSAYAYVGVWTEYKAYTAGSVVRVTMPTFPVSYRYYTAKNYIPSSTISPNFDLANWGGTPTPDVDSRFTEAPTSWPLHTATLNTSTFALVDVPGFYNSLNFTWLRGAKTLLDDKTAWGIVGEQILGQGEGDAVFGARYVSGFDTPPGVILSPDAPTTVLRGTPRSLDASGTQDTSQDPLTFIWSIGEIEALNESHVVPILPYIVNVNNSSNFDRDAGVSFNGTPGTNVSPSLPASSLQYSVLNGAYNFYSGDVGTPVKVSYFYKSSPYISVTPSASGSTASLLVSRSIGGDAHNFNVGVVATTTAYPAMTVTNISISGNVLTVGTNAPVDLAATENVFLYNIATATFLNDLVFTVTGVSGDSFTANYTHPDYASTPDTGHAIASPQFDWCNISVPINPPPTIDFTHDGTTHQPVTLPIAAARNSTVTINPTYTGNTDPDDATTYTWTQTSGTHVTVLGGTSSPTLQIETNGTLIQGESLGWSLSVNDAVNPVAIGAVTVVVAPYAFEVQDTLQLSRSLWGPYAPLSQRNTVQPWTPLDTSAIYTNFQSIKRNSVLNGSDRYLLISPASVCVYGGVNPNMVLLRRLFVPLDSQGDQNPIMDAMHTEDDTTLVLDSEGNLYRYSTAPLINTDSPDTIIALSSTTSMSFNKVFSTYSFNNSRIIILTGPNGCLLLQVENKNMAIQGSLELTVEAGTLYGIDNVQFVRTSNVESLNTGKILLGTIASITADIQSIGILGNAVTVVANNTFTEGQAVTFQDITRASFLNGVKAPVVSATPIQFVVSYEYGDYAVTDEVAGAVAVAGGKTYETLIDLSHGQIIGTFDASNLHNQYVTTGEILFETNDTYAGAPAAPVLNPIVNNGTIGNGYANLAISWSAIRPDLIQYYSLESSLDETNWTPTIINSGYTESITLPELGGQFFYFRIRATSGDGSSPYSNIQTISTGGSGPPPPVATGFAIEFGAGFGTT